MESFSEQFIKAWKNPTPEGLASLLSEDVVLYQPHLPPIRGKQQAIQEFRKLLKWIPGAHSEVTFWKEDTELAFIEHILKFPVGSNVIEIHAVDRFTLENGRGKERVVYFNMLSLIAGVLKHPSLWLGYVNYRFGGKSV